jgi:hypothetical protein
MSEEIAEVAAVPLDRLTRIYIKIRNAKQALTKEFEEKEKELKDSLAEISNAMKDQMLATGSKSTRTEFGTVILGKKVRYFPSDWGVLKPWLQENDLLDLLEKRIAQQNMAKYLEDNPDVAPPGLNSESEVVITVRRPS